MNEEKEINYKDVFIMNYTPHYVNVILENGDRVSFPPITDVNPNAVVPRCVEDHEIIYYVKAINGMKIPVEELSYGRVENLPDKREGTVFIVSSNVAKAATERDDLVIPQDMVRNPNGNIIGCRRLAKVSVVLNK